MKHHTMHLAKSGKVTMEASRLRAPYIEIYNNLNTINLSFMEEIFRLRVTNRAVHSQYKLHLNISKISHVSFGNKSIVLILLTLHI